jgi:hypothetical protein
MHTKTTDLEGAAVVLECFRDVLRTEGFAEESRALWGFHVLTSVEIQIALAAIRGMRGLRGESAALRGYVVALLQNAVSEKPLLMAS